MHGFVRGIGGAVVTFPEAADRARLWLAAEDEVGRGELDENHAHFPVMTCTMCGQHYYIAFLKDFIFTVKRYRSEKTADEDGWRHVSVVLEPVNAEFAPIELRTEDEGSVTVVAELVEVIGSESPV